MDPTKFVLHLAGLALVGIAWTIYSKYEIPLAKEVLHILAVLCGLVSVYYFSRAATKTGQVEKALAWLYAITGVLWCIVSLFY